MSYTKVPITGILINSVGNHTSELRITVTYQTGEEQEFPITILKKGDIATVVFDYGLDAPIPDKVIQIMPFTPNKFRLIRVQDEE